MATMLRLHPVQSWSICKLCIRFECVIITPFGVPTGRQQRETKSLLHSFLAMENAELGDLLVDPEVYCRMGTSSGPDKSRTMSVCVAPRLETLPLSTWLINLVVELQGILVLTLRFSICSIEKKN